MFWNKDDLFYFVFPEVVCLPWLQQSLYVFFQVFFKVVLPTHDSCHVQFLIFYICSFDEVCFKHFLSVVFLILLHHVGC